ELESGLNARDAVTEVVRPGAGDRAQDFDGFLLRDKDAHVARQPWDGGEPTADADGEALAAFVDRADERDAVDLRRVAAVCARGDRVLVLPRQVGEVRVPVEEARRLLDDPAAVEQLVRVEALHRAARDVPHSIPAAAARRDPRGIETR